MKRYSDCPQILREFLIYHENIKGQSQLTINEYYLDLRMFLRFIKLMRSDMPINARLYDIDIRGVDIHFVRDITTSDIFDFLSYLDNKKIPTTVRQVIIPTLNDNEDNINRLSGIVSRFSCVDKVELLPFKKMCNMKYEKLGIPFPFGHLPEPTKEKMNELQMLV